MSAPSRPALRDVRVLSFDAGGTLFQVAEPVGETYARLARDAGFVVAADALEEGFRRAFAAAPPLAATSVPPGGLLAFERAWWRSVVAASLAHALGASVTAGDPVFERFFDVAFAHYAHGAAWRVYPEVHAVLTALRPRPLILAVISNFDRRLHAVLEELGLGGAFAAAVASSAAGATKPDPAIFARARSLLGDPPAEVCLHVGDTLAEDVAGAIAAGWHAVWLDRGGADPGAAGTRAIRITSLAELPDLLQSSGG